MYLRAVFEYPVAGKAVAYMCLDTARIALAIDYDTKTAGIVVTLAEIHNEGTRTHRW
jgi:hypothetical protein